jgi:hypothetical protein
MAPIVGVRIKKHRAGVKSFFDSLERDVTRQGDASSREHVEEHNTTQKVRTSFMMLAQLLLALVRS